MPDKVDYLIVGGGLAGAQAARSIRDAGGAGRVVILGREPELPYNRPPLSKGFLQGKEPRESIYVKPAQFWADLGVEILTGRNVTSLDRQARAVLLEDGSALGFGKLLLATGSEPRALDAPGKSLAGIHYLRTVADSAAIREAARQARQAVVVGGGFIGAEAAASLAAVGLDVTLLVGDEVLLGRQLGQGAGRFLMDYFRQQGISLETRARAAAFLGPEKFSGVKLADGRSFSGDLAVVGVGVQPRTDLAQAAGLAVDNGVTVDSHFRTPDPDIYAAGDVANFVDQRYGRRFRIEHWDHAKASGKAAGLNMAGQSQSFDHLPYFFSDMFDLEIEAWGDIYQTDEVIEQHAGTRAAGQPAWHYLHAGRLAASAIVNATKEERKAVQALLAGRPEATPELRAALAAGSWLERN